MKCAYCGHMTKADPHADPYDCEGCGRRLTIIVGLHHRYADLPHQAPDKDPQAYVLQGPRAELERAALADIEKAEDGSTNVSLMLAH